MHPNIERYWRQVMVVESLDEHAVGVTAEQKLMAVLKFAASNVPYYKKWFSQSGISEKDLKLQDFPVIKKKDIRGHESEFVANGWQKRLHWTRTSGSTGEPFRFARSEYDYSYATLWRGLARFGIRPGDKRVLVKGVDETASVASLTRIKRTIYGWLNRCVVVDAHFLARSDANVEKELKRILAYQPDYFHGYASSIYLLARYAADHDVDCSRLKLKAIVTESEKCHEFQREVIERVFHAPVVENYGCVEFGMIAQPAKDGQLCVNEDHVYAETTPEGEAVFTNLDEYGFPLIRFKNGDKITIGKVHDELPYRILTSIEGRVAEAIRLPQGGSLQGYIVMYPISKHMKFIKEYQVFQPDIAHLFVRVVEAQALPAEVEAQILREMRDIVGGEINLKIEKVKAIPLTKRGKRAFVCSDVKE